MINLFIYLYLFVNIIFFIFYFIFEDIINYLRNGFSGFFKQESDKLFFGDPTITIDIYFFEYFL